MHSDEPIRERATSKPFSEIVDDIDLKRRSVLKAGMGTAALALFGIPAALKPTSAMAVTLGFNSLPFPPYPADSALRPGKHESAVYSIASDGRLVVYSGDDQTFEYIYKWVSAQPYNPVNRTANLNLLDDGTLYVAKFNAGAVAGDNAGDGQWLELSMSVPALHSAFGGDLGMPIDTRTAADLVGATPMDRPEWIAVHPTTKEVYCTLTNNTARAATGPTGVDEANPRASNRYGHIIRWQEAGGDPGASTFNWNIFILAGDPGLDGDSAGSDESNINGDIFGSPDGIWFDNQARLWIKTDISSSALGLTNYINMPNNMMLAADPVGLELPDAVETRIGSGA